MLQFVCRFFTFVVFLVTASTALSGYKYYLSLCTVFKNDAPWLKEWIEYNKLLGVEHFRLYNNGSTDNYLEVLAPYIANGLVTVVDWPDRQKKSKQLCAWVNKTQIPAFLDAAQKLSKETRWLAIIDTDEFIVPRKHDNLTDFLRQYDSNDIIGGIAINWMCYGASSVWDIPPGKLMIECLTRKGLDSHIWSFSVKSIVHPEFVQNSYSPHYYGFIKRKITVSPDGSVFKPGTSYCVDTIKINHYYARTLNFFYNEKIQRKMHYDNVTSISEEQIQEMLKAGDQEEDIARDIFRFVPALREAMGFNN